MKFCSFFLLLLLVLQGFSQGTASDEKAFADCKTPRCKIEKALLISENYLEKDKIENAQKWLDLAKKQILKSPEVSHQYMINSLQSELFYYMGLYQFGLHEAQKGTQLATELQDSLYRSNAHLLEGINLFEMNKLPETETALQKAKRHFPQNTVSAYRRFIINKEYIYNNLAQLKIKMNQNDSSYFYNKKAYFFAKKQQDYRCVANVERTFGELFLKQNEMDSARYYFNKTIATSLDAKIYDTALLGYGNLMECFSNQPEIIQQLFEKGQFLIVKHNINATFQKLFYTQSLSVFKSIGDAKKLFTVQQQLLEIEQNRNKTTNFYTQKITNQYINSENKLLLSKINELDKQKNIKILQLVLTVFLALIFLLVIIIIRRKNKLQKLLLDQKNEISKDLHDDIGSELSSILINTNLLKIYHPNDKQQILIDKINNTSSEISQRLNTFIWSLDTDNNTVQHFSEYVKTYAYKFLDGTKIRLHLINDTDAISHKLLNGNSRKNLFFCIKEALNNIVKHAEATEVTVSISAIEKKSLFITISDNGKGLPAENKLGNGLINIKKRIATLNGDLKIDSANGLKISISIPF